MTTALITIQNVTSNSLIARYSSSSDFWANVADSCAVFVVIGVFAEFLEIAPKILKAGLELKWNGVVARRAQIESLLARFKRHEHGIEVLDFCFWIVIVVALAGELAGGRMARHFDSITIGILNGRAAQLEKDAQSFRLKADELEEKMKDREITKDQIAKFKAALYFLQAQKKPVWIVTANPSRETLNFISELRKMLDDAGYGVRHASE